MQHQSIKKISLADALQMWEQFIGVNGERLDQSCEVDWESLAIGFFLGLGMSNEESRTTAYTLYLCSSDTVH